MRIALTVKGAGLGAWLDEDFAHCGHVMIVEENYRFKAWENPNKKDDASVPENLIKSILLENVDLLVTGNILPSDKERFVEEGVEVLENKSGAVLSLLDEITST